MNRSEAIASQVEHKLAARRCDGLAFCERIVTAPAIMCDRCAREIYDSIPEPRRKGNGRISLDRDLAYAAGRDAGNRSMRKAGRKHWNEDDYNAAARECNRLLDIVEANS